MFKSPFTVFSDCENKLVLCNGLFYHSKIIIVSAPFYFNHLTIKMLFGRKISSKLLHTKWYPEGVLSTVALLFRQHLQNFNFWLKYSCPQICWFFKCRDLLSNSPYCVPYSSCNVSLENLVLDQLIPNWFMSLYSLLVYSILWWYCKEKFCLGHSCKLKG